MSEVVSISLSNSSSSSEPCQALHAPLGVAIIMMSSTLQRVSQGTQWTLYLWLDVPIIINKY